MIPVEPTERSGVSRSSGLEWRLPYLHREIPAMRSLLFVVGSFLVTILAWGVYGPVLHWGQHGMSTADGLARMRPFVCVGLAYFAIGVVVPAVLLKLRGEQGDWTMRGILFSLAGGALGAVGALGIIMAFNFGGRPVYVMPLVFGGAPVVNSVSDDHSGPQDEGDRTGFCCRIGDGTFGSRYGANVRSQSTASTRGGRR